MYWHYFVIVVSIACIIFWQFKIYRRTNKRRKIFEDIYPDNSEKEWTILKDNGVRIVSKREEISIKKSNLERRLKEIDKEIDLIEKKIKDYEGHYDDINTSTSDGDLLYEALLEKSAKEKDVLVSKQKEINKQIKKYQEEIDKLTKEDSLQETRGEIIRSINRYLEKNQNTVIDFNLIRDIIDRNSDAVEEEIQTQIPVPLYFGLIGTMFGILIGVGVLVVDGSLANLLSSTDDAAQSIKGIVALFGGVALAMISSIIGILLTTIGSLQNKKTKVRVEHKKHAFLSWLQAELLPKVSTDFSSALIQLGRDLTEFNGSFSSNAKLLKKTVTDIGTTTEAQSNLLSSIEKLKITRIAKANIDVYEQLKNCTDDIANLSRDLKEIQNSISGIGQFMQDGIKEYERRNTYIQDASGKVDIAISEGQKKLTESANQVFQQYNDLLHKLYIDTESTTKELAKKYEEETDRLHRAIVDKLTDVKQLENELKNLVAVKVGIANLEKATTEQNRKIDSLTKEIRELAQVKATGGSANVEMKMPKAYRILIVVVGGVVTLTSLFFVVLRVLESFHIVL